MRQRLHFILRLCSAIQFISEYQNNQNNLYSTHIQGHRQQVSGGVATYEELARQLRPLIIENILWELRLTGNEGRVRLHEISVFLHILIEPTFLADLFADLFEDC